MNVFQHVSAIVISAERPAILKTVVGVTGTWFSAPDIQFYVAAATFVFMAMNCVVIWPKFRSTLRQLQVDRERKRQADNLHWSDIQKLLVKEKAPEKVSWFCRLRGFFKRKEK